MPSITIDNVELILSNPIAVDNEWIGQQEPMRQLMACWLTVADSDLPLTPRGTAFQLAVWTLLRSIPAGATTTYGALARQLAGQREGRIPAAQAVGGAVGHNPIAIIIPCHRVVGADGSLTGYAGGLDRKAALLALENAKHPSLQV